MGCTHTSESISDQGLDSGSCMALKIPNNLRTACKLQLIEGKAVVRDLLLLRRLGAFERSLYCKPYAFIVNI